MDHETILFRTTESVKEITRRKIKRHVSDASPPHHVYETKASMSEAAAGRTNRPTS
jgi:hypothetical protein